MQNKNFKNTTIGLVFSFLILGLVFCGVSASAATNKILVTDNDGDGSISIGDKFCLKSECFYVTKNADGSVKALAEYNLYVGANYDKVILNINDTYIRSELINNGTAWGNYAYFFEGEEVDGELTWYEKIRDKYNPSYSDYRNGFVNQSYIEGEEYVVDGVTYKKKTLKFYPIDAITESTGGYARQNELARGVTGEKGNANYPIYATTRLGFGPGFWSGVDMYKDGYGNFGLRENNPVVGYLSDYKEALNAGNNTVSDVELPRIDDIDNLVHEVSGSYLPLTEWYNAASRDSSSDELGNYSELGELKGRISNDYAWLWNTTYWLSTFAIDSDSVDQYNNYTNSFSPYAYFVSSAGDICFSEACSVSIPRAGIRPIITISADKFELNSMNIVGTVRWIDNKNFSKIRPDKTVIKLYRNGVLIGSTVVTKDDDEDLWRFSFKNLLKYDPNGELYVYTITQNDIAMYSSDITNFDVVNAYAPSSSDNSNVTNPKTDAVNPFVYLGIIGAIVTGVFASVRRLRR